MQRLQHGAERDSAVAKPKVIVTAGALTDEERLKVLLCQSIRQPGLNPNNTFTLLHGLLKRDFNADDNDAAKNFIAFVKQRQPQGMGMEPEQLLKVVNDLKHPHEVAPHNNPELKAQMTWMRQRVSELLIAPRQKPGTNQYTSAADNVRSKNAGNGRVVTIARLKADPKHADLYAKVIAGELSANAAAIEAGFRQRTVSVPITVDAWVAATRKHFSIEQRREIAEAIAESES